MEQEELLSSLIVGLTFPAACVDSRGDVVLFNPAFARTMAIAAEQLRGQSLTELFPEARNRVKTALERAWVPGATAARAEVVRDSAAYEINFARAGADKKSPMLMVTLTDRTEIDGLHHRLLSSEARLTALADHADDGVLVTNEHGELIYVNHHALRLLGVKGASQSLLGLSTLELFDQSGELTDPDREQLAALADHEPFRFTSVRSNHRIKAIRLPAGLDREGITSSPIAGGAQNAQSDNQGGSLFIFELEHAAPGEGHDGAKGHLIETIGQELAVVLEGSTAALIRAEQMELDPSLLADLDRIRGAAEGALTGIASLVELQRPRQGYVPGVKSTFELRPFVGKLIHHIVMVAEEVNVAVRVKVEQDVAQSLTGDVVRLKLALKTLLECALQSVPREVSLTVTPDYFTDKTLNASFSVMAVGGPGSGLKDNPTATAVLTKTGRLKTLTPGGQSAMRLSIAAYAINALGGQLRSTTQRDGSVSHSFSLSLEVAATPPMPARPSYVSLNGMTVLVVSANAKQRLQLATWLKAVRMLPLEADNAAMALALMNRMHEEGSPVPLVVLENNLPVQDGFLLSFRIKNDEKLRHTLLVMLANQGRPGDAQLCKDNNIAAYLPQPVGRARLIEAITAVTGAREDVLGTTGLQQTLVTRHTLREGRKGATVLLIESDADTLQRAEMALRKQDATLLIATTPEEAASAIAQDVYDLVVVSADMPGLEPATAVFDLKSRMLRNAESTPFVAITSDPSKLAPEHLRAWGYSALMEKPLERDELITLMIRAVREKLARPPSAS